MIDTQKLRQSIQDNAAEIRRLHSRVQEAHAHSRLDTNRMTEWKEACDEFHARFDLLSFPGGFTGAFERLLSGDTETIEAAICFLEVRPYFFRSGYMFKDVLRKCKHAPLSDEQASRLQVVTANLAEWRLRKKPR